MWYVVNVRSGCEEQALQLLQEHAAACGVQELFVPRCEIRKREMDERHGRGEVHTTAEPMIPGCVIAVASGAREMRAMIRHSRGVDGLLCSGMRSFESLNDAEVVLIERLIQPHKRTAAFSEGYISGSRVVVTNGPLQELEDVIAKVDHHKKRAYVRLTIAGRKVDAALGLRITAKRESAA